MTDEWNGLSQRKMLQELYTAMLGVPGTGDKGLVGKVHRIESELTNINGCVQTNTAWRKYLTVTLGVIISGVIALWQMIIRN